MQADGRLRRCGCGEIGAVLLAGCVAGVEEKAKTSKRMLREEFDC